MSNSTSAATGRRRGFFQVDNAIFDGYHKLVKPEGLLIYCYLRRRAGAKDQCWVKAETIERDTGVSRATVFRRLRDLETAGLIRRASKHTGRSGRGYGVNRYSVFEPAANGLSAATTSSPSETVVASQAETDTGSERDGDRANLRRTPSQGETQKKNPGTRLLQQDSLEGGNAPSQDLVEDRMDAYLQARGVDPGGCGAGQREKLRRALADLPPQFTAADVGGCTEYFLNDWFWSQPGQLGVQKVAETVPQWVAYGRPHYLGSYDPYDAPVAEEDGSPIGTPACAVAEDDDPPPF